MSEYSEWLQRNAGAQFASATEERHAFETERLRIRISKLEAERESLRAKLAAAERHATVSTAIAYAANSPDHIVAAMREMPANVLERVLAPFAHEKGKLLVERRAAEARAEDAERVAFEQQLELDDLRAELAAARGIR